MAEPAPKAGARSAPGEGGRIITFYSYKGGTGRSMTLANVAWILASRGKRVLVVDWDLEAPGVHRYFRPFLIDADLVATDGIIDMVVEYATDAVTAGPEEPDWHRRHADAARLAVSLDHSFEGGGRLFLLPAGRQGPSYSTRVNTFDWRRFYERLSGGAFLDAFKASLRECFDYILIDSRTGVSDTAGICTVQLPDALVVCFTLNDQSIEGAAGIAASVLEQRRDGLPVFPVPMRVELAEKEKLEQRRALCRSRFALFPNALDASERSRYWGAVEVLYVPFYAYEEILAPMGDAPGQTASILASCERLAGYLSDGEVTALAPVPEATRLALLARYTQRGSVEIAAEALDAAAEGVYARLSKDEQTAARDVFTRLVHVSYHSVPPRPSPAPLLELSPLGGAGNAGLNAFFTAGLLRTETGAANGVEMVEIAYPELPARWKRLARWIEEDRDFLAWRQDLQSAELQWTLAARAPTALLYGESLARARQWAGAHGARLTAGERAFIEASAAHVRRRGLRGVVRNVAVGGAAAAFVIFSLLQTRADERRADIAAWMSAATAFAESSQADSAASYFRRVLALDANSVEARLGLADAQLLQGDAAGAEATYGTALAIVPARDSLLRIGYRGRARARTAQGDVDGAIEDLTALLHRDDADVDALFDRGTAYQSRGDAEAAAADFERVIRLAGDPATREAATTRLVQLGRDPPDLAGQVPGPTLVYIHAMSAEDAKVGARLETALQREGFQVLGTEVRRESTRGDVRSFFSADREAAERAGAIAEKELAGLGYRVRLQRLELDSANFPSARRRLIEIWLPPLTAPAATSRVPVR